MNATTEIKTPLARPDATDLLIEAGQLVEGPLLLNDAGKPGSPRFLASLPVEQLASLAIAARHFAQEASILGEVNADLRRQRDELAAQYRTLRFLASAHFQVP